MVNRKLGGRPENLKSVFGGVQEGYSGRCIHSSEGSHQSQQCRAIQGAKLLYWRKQKGSVISLTSQRSVVVLFAILAGFGDWKVRNYFSRSLKGSRSGKSKLIVNRDKNFVFYYKYKQRKLVVEFHYGVWNASGYPLHT